MVERLDKLSPGEANISALPALGEVWVVRTHRGILSSVVLEFGVDCSKTLIVRSVSVHEASTWWSNTLMSLCGLRLTSQLFWPMEKSGWFEHIAGSFP